MQSSSSLLQAMVNTAPQCLDVSFTHLFFICKGGIVQNVLLVYGTCTVIRLSRDTILYSFCFIHETFTELINSKPFAPTCCRDEQIFQRLLWISSLLTLCTGDNHFHTTGESTLDKYFIDYREYVQQQFLVAQSSCSSSAGLGRTSWLLNHTASLVWLAMMARSTNGPAKGGGRRRRGKNPGIVLGNMWSLEGWAVKKNAACLIIIILLH